MKEQEEHKEKMRGVGVRAAELKQGHNRLVSGKIKDFGICSKCGNSKIVEDEFGQIILAICDEIEGKILMLSPARKVKKCSGFWDKSHRGIDELKAIAWLIDIKKDTIGFIKPDYKVRYVDYD
jgi:hypothetical protein